MEFPPSTVVNKVFSESKFFKKLALSKSRLPFGTISKIIWCNKLSASSINLEGGKKVREIQVFEVKLKQEKVPEQILRIIDNNIPYHILFLIEFEGRYQAWIGYKEVGENGVSLTVKSYYKSDWCAFESLPLEIKGLNLDEVYENFISQLGLGVPANGDSDLRERVDIAAEIEKIEREILKHKAKMLNEKQFNKQVAINDKIKSLKLRIKILKDKK